MISLIQSSKNIIEDKYEYKRAIDFNEEHEDTNDEEDYGFFPNINNRLDESMTVINSYTNTSLENSLNNDILVQGEYKNIWTIFSPFINIKEQGTMSYPSHLYVVITKPGI